MNRLLRNIGKVEGNKMKKFELTENSKLLPCGRVVFQIRALKSFDNVKKGALGGYIEKEKNLSHKGNAWKSEAKRS